MPETPRNPLHRPLCPDGQHTSPPAGYAPCKPTSQRYVLAATILASAMAFIDGSVITIAMPAIQAEFAASFGKLTWIINAYALVLGSLILIGGGLGDTVGRRRIFLIGLAVFAAASAACALAPNIDILIAARALKGLGAAFLVPQSLAIISASFPTELRGGAIGLWAGASALTTALGPPLGGFLVDWFDWRSIFWMNIPLSAAALALTVIHIPESRNPSATGSLDYQGSVLAIAALGALTFGLTLLAENGASVLLAMGAAGVGVICLWLFIRWEAAAPSPLMPLSLFTNRTFSAANIMTVLLYGGLTGILFLLPFDLLSRRGLSASDVGLVMLPIGLIIGLVSKPAGDWAERLGPRVMLATGSGLVGLSAMGLALMIDDIAIGVIMPVVVLAFGMALVVAPLTTMVMNSAPKEASGAASGVNNAASRLAGLFYVAGIGAISAVFYAGLDLSFGTLPDRAAEAYLPALSAFVDAYTAGLVLCAISAIAAAATATQIKASRPA